MPRVLIVDDDPAARELISTTLSLAGIEAESAANGRVALERLCARTVERRPFDVVLLDIVMPEVDGWQVLKAIKNNPLWKGIRVVIVSGQADTAEDLMRIIEYDGVYVEKRSGFAQTVAALVARLTED